jgi:hypothetical protein
LKHSTPAAIRRHGPAAAAASRRRRRRIFVLRTFRFRAISDDDKMPRISLIFDDAMLGLAFAMAAMAHYYHLMLHLILMGDSGRRISLI